MLLQFYGGACSLELRLGLLGVLLLDLLEDRLGSTVHEVLGLLEAEAGQGTDFLDDLDLLVAGTREDDVELALLFFGCGIAAAAGGSGCGCGYGSGCGDAEALFELLEELAELQYGQLSNAVQNLVLGQGSCHRRYSLFLCISLIGR